MGEGGDAEKGDFVVFLRGEGGEEGGEGGYAKICHGDKRGSAMTAVVTAEALYPAGRL